jgi:chorismate lyase
MSWTTRISFSGQERRWVGAPGSLSARLAAAGQSFSVQVLNQGMQKLRADEAQALGWSVRKLGYVREVVLRVDGAAVVFARSVTAQAQSHGPWRSIRGLGTRPLADVLFKRVGIVRAPLQFTTLHGASPVNRHVARAWKAGSGDAPMPRAMPARRSVFRRRGAPLLVMEVFAADQVPWCWPSSRSRSVKSLSPRKC